MCAVSQFGDGLFQAGLAGRYEDFTDFGGRFTWKASARGLPGWPTG